MNAGEFSPPSCSDLVRGDGDQREERPPSPAETLAETALVFKAICKRRCLHWRKFSQPSGHPEICSARSRDCRNLDQFLNEALIRFRTEVVEPNKMQNCWQWPGIAARLG